VRVVIRSRLGASTKEIEVSVGADDTISLDELVELARDVWNRVTGPPGQKRCSICGLYECECPF
jgi:hypothetical protein